eukprot:TRINITY_DN9675_c0_g1_i1.p1 TRINITY_DN9675_c0_g1~~TRINITY_DN9675_c0_g1_i1.p1  ORF type:complete len:106 (+),score=22.88 TRINITY_DN9675_c0_g1_i1:522-839(+)
MVFSSFFKSKLPKAAPPASRGSRMPPGIHQSLRFSSIPVVVVAVAVAVVVVVVVVVQLFSFFGVVVQMCEVKHSLLQKHHGLACTGIAFRQLSKHQQLPPPTRTY